jgi:hypothetical protein
MSTDEYHTYWNRFRNSGFNPERVEHFNVGDFEAQGSSSAAFMAADNVATTSLYSCPIHNILGHTPFGESEQDMYVFVFDRHETDKPNGLITHSCELNYLFDPDQTGG